MGKTKKEIPKTRTRTITRPITRKKKIKINESNIKETSKYKEQIRNIQIKRT